MKQPSDHWPCATSPQHLIMAQQHSGIARRWCFTLNNPTPEERDTLRQIGENITNLPWLEYLVYGFEVGEQGTPHLQGFLILSARMRFTTINNHIWGQTNNQRIHWEVTRGTPQQAADYCKKDGQFEEYGEQPSKPINQWTRIKQLIDEGATTQAIREEYPKTWCAYRSSIEAWINEGRQARLQAYDGELQQKNFWIWGPSGIGKSTKARTYGTPVYNKGINRWWDGYNYEPVVIMDDLPPVKADVLVDHLKRWLDRFPFPAEVKTSTMMISPNDYKLIITSNYSPEQCFREPDLSAIRRRLTVIHMDQMADRDTT